jgi:hypothetical protein
MLIKKINTDSKVISKDEYSKFPSFNCFSVFLYLIKESMAVTDPTETKTTPKYQNIL